MSYGSLQVLTSDPKNGVVVRHSNVYLVLGREDFRNIKESLVKMLKLNLNKYYPDAGGILMGYQDIKVEKRTSELAPTCLLIPVLINAKFYLFQPQVGSNLFCVVHTREEKRVRCLVHGVFMVDVISPPECCQSVFVGQTVLVTVLAVEQLAWQEPKILASLVENTSDNIIPLIEFVEEIDSDNSESDNGNTVHSRKRKCPEDSQAPVASPAKKKLKKSSPAVTVAKPTKKAKVNSSQPFSADPESPSSPHTPSHSAHKHQVNRKVAPPGFDNMSKNRRRVKLVTSHVPGRYFYSYRAAWEWADGNPDYMSYKDKAESPAGASEDDTEDITPAVPEDFTVSEVTQVKAKPLKLDQNQNLLSPESDTEYQSQSLLTAPLFKMAKKAKKVAKKSPKAVHSKNRLTLSKKSPRAGISKSHLDVSNNSPEVMPPITSQQAQASSSSVSKSPAVQVTPTDDSGAGCKPEPMKRAKVSSHSSPVEKQPSQRKSGRYVTISQAKVSPSDSSSSYKSDIDDATAASPSESKAKTAPVYSSSSESESDSE